MRNRYAPHFSLRLAVLGALLAIGLVALRVPSLGAAAAPPSPVPERSLVSNDGTYRLHCTSEPETIPWGTRFSIEVRAARVDGAALAASLAVDARMPEHGHGMNREPVVEELEDGSWRVRNLLFHMPGYWEVYFDLTRGAITERAQFSVEVD